MLTPTPETIRAAERVRENHRQHAIETVDVLACVGHILANRSDYDTEGRPLPVDEEWLNDLGFRWRQIDCNGQCLSLIMHDDESESPDHITLLVWNDDGSWGLWGMPRFDDIDWETMPLIKRSTLAKTRPQLRSLLAALGR